MPRFVELIREHAENDRDRAKAEFIRVSCFGHNYASGRMSRKVYQWIGEHWRRLVPLTRGHHVSTW